MRSLAMLGNPVQCQKKPLARGFLMSANDCRVRVQYTGLSSGVKVKKLRNEPRKRGKKEGYSLPGSSENGTRRE